MFIGQCFNIWSYVYALYLQSYNNILNIYTSSRSIYCITILAQKKEGFPFLKYFLDELFSGFKK